MNDFVYRFMFRSLAIYGDVCIYDGAIFDPVTLGEYMEAKGLKYSDEKPKIIHA